MIIIKPGASIEGCRKEILTALIVDIQSVFHSENLDTVVTSGKENFKHSVKRSSHYRGDALDIRSKHIKEDRKNIIYQNLKQRLGQDFVVILESRGKAWEHFHIHWSPVFDATEYGDRA